AVRREDWFADEAGCRLCDRNQFGLRIGQSADEQLLIREVSDLLPVTRNGLVVNARVPERLSVWKQERKADNATRRRVQFRCKRPNAKTSQPAADGGDQRRSDPTRSPPRRDQPGLLATCGGAAIKRKPSNGYIADALVAIFLEATEEKVPSA